MVSTPNAQISFAAGEIDEEIAYRGDLAQHAAGAAEVFNFIPRAQGGLRRTPGTLYRGPQANEGDTGRIMPFVLSASDSLIVEMTPGLARFWQAGNLITSGGDPYTLATPFTASNLASMVIAQSGDILWCFSEARTTELRRLTATSDNWEFVDATFSRGPFRDPNRDEAKTIEASAITGDITLTASVPIWVAGHVGAIWRIDEQTPTKTQKWLGGTAYVTGDTVRVNGAVYRAVNDAESGANAPSHLEGTQGDGGGLNWEYLHSGFGIVQITGYTSATEVAATVLIDLPQSLVLTAAVPGDMTTPEIPASGEVSHRWSEGAFSTVRGWPRAGAFFDGRLWAGGEGDVANTLYSSALQGFDDWESGTDDDRAIVRPLNDGTVNAIRWMAPGSNLVIGTEGREWVADVPSQSSSITPSTLRTRSTTQQGSILPAVVVNSGRVLFADGSRKAVFESFYELSNEGYVTQEISVLSEHLTARGIRRMAWHNRPYRALWMAMDDGSLVSCTYHREQQVLAWAQHDVAGTIEDICVTPTPDGTEDQLHLLVRRQIDGVTRRYYEVLAPQWTRGMALSEARYLDCAVERTVTNGFCNDLDHLEGQTIGVLVDAGRISERQVINGQIAIDPEISGGTAVIGLPKTARVRTLPFAAQGGVLGRKGRLSDIIVVVKDCGLGVLSRNGQTVPIHEGFGQGTSQELPLFSGPIGVKGLGGIDRTMDLEIEFSDPYPATVTAIRAEYGV